MKQLLIEKQNSWRDDKKCKYWWQIKKTEWGRGGGKKEALAQDLDKHL